MNFLKILWQHVFQQKGISSEQEEALSALRTDFSTTSLSTEALVNLVKDTDFQELVTEDGSLQFRFAIQEGELESASEELAFQTAELLLKFEPPKFPDEALELGDSEMQGLDERFWEKYVFDENFIKNIPDFTKPEFQSIPFDTFTLDEHSS